MTLGLNLAERKGPSINSHCRCDTTDDRPVGRSLASPPRRHIAQLSDITRHRTTFVDSGARSGNIDIAPRWRLVAPSLHRSLGGPARQVSKTEMRCASQARRGSRLGPEARVSGACLVLAAYQHVGMAHQARGPFALPTEPTSSSPRCPSPWNVTVLRPWQRIVCIASARSRPGPGGDGGDGGGLRAIHQRSKSPPPVHYYYRRPSASCSGFQPEGKRWQSRTGCDWAARSATPSPVEHSSRITR